MRNYHEIDFWADVSTEQWNNWHWQVKNRITTIEQLNRVISLTGKEAEQISSSLGRLRMAITPYYAALIDPADPGCPIRRQSVPSTAELNTGDAELEDPLYEEIDSPVTGLTHRYPDRVLLLITDQCCRQCPVE